MTTIEPLGTRVMIRSLEKESKTASGIILPEIAKEKPQQGMIEAVGDADETLTDLSIGDKMLFPIYTGTEIQLDSVDYLIMGEGDFLARITE